MCIRDRNAYAQLSEEEQSRVVNYPILQQARARYEQLKTAQDEEENGCLLYTSRCV